MREAVPYDYGDIDVIDELMLAPPGRGESKKSNEEEQRESPTQSTISEHSLRNVVTAAEDFIKVLATVSTSQSSNADSDKDEMQTSEKKKRKNSGKRKKTNKKHKGKGKSRKRKQKTEAGAKTEEGAVVSPPGSKAEDVLTLSNFLSESNKHDRSRINANMLDVSEFELRRTDEPSNQVMKDEPAKDMETVSITSTLTIQKKLAESETEERKEEISLSESQMAATPHKTKTRGQRRGGRKKIKKTSALPSSEHLRSTSADSVKNKIDLLPTAGPEQHSSTITSTASVPPVVPKVQRSRSKERGDKEGRKKRKKVNSDSPIVPSDQQDSSMDNLTASLFTGSPIIASNTELTLLSTPFYRPDSQVTALSPDFTALKRPRSKERVQRNRRRKTAILSSGQNLLSFHSGRESVNLLTTPHTLAAWPGPVSIAALQDTEAHNEGRPFTTATPTVNTNLPMRSSKRQKSIPKQNKTETLPISRIGVRSRNPWMTTTAVPSMSPRQFSVARARSQFNRKKRRKALLLNRK